MLTIILLLLIAWLLWTIHQDLQESNERQRTMRTAINRLIELVEKPGNNDGTGAGKDERQTASPQPAAAAPTGPISLNTASKAELRKLPKVGAVVAQRIIDARPFESVEQLKNIDGVTDKLYEEIAPKTSV